MQSAFYWLEDHFDARAAAGQGNISGWAARRLSVVCACIGDALSGAFSDERPHRHSPAMFSKSR